MGSGWGWSRASPSLGNEKEAWVYSNHEIVCSRQWMQSASFFPLAALRSHPAERFQVPDFRRPCQRESGRLWGSPAVCIPEWRITRLIDVKVCRDNSLPRQPTNPLIMCLLCHPDWLFLCLFPCLCVFLSERGLISCC